MANNVNHERNSVNLEEFESFIPEQSWVLQYLIPAGRSEYLHFDDSRNMFSLASGSRHLIIRRWMPDPQFLLHCEMTNCREREKMGEMKNAINDKS